MAKDVNLQKLSRNLSVRIVLHTTNKCTDTTQDKGYIEYER